MNNLLLNMSEVLKNSYWLAPIISLLAGVLTSIMPCSLSSVPLVIGYVGGIGVSNTKKALKLSLVFALGLSITFTILGATATILGKLIGGAGNWWYIVLGVITVMMSLQTFEIITFIKPTNLQTKNTKKGYLGALLSGILAGIFSSPCSTPVLIVILALVSKSSNVLWGIFLLLMYSIGYSALVIVAGTSMGTIRKITKNEKYRIIK